MRNLLLTIAIGDLHTQMAYITHPFMAMYADKIGAEFYVIDSQMVSKATPHWEKFRIYDLLNAYDRIIYVDTDALIKQDCPDLFDIVPANRLGAFNEGQSLPRPKSNYYNTGVMVVSKGHQDVFRKPAIEDGGIENFFEQNTINRIIQEQGTRMYDLHPLFNHMDFMEGDGYIIHKAGNLNALQELKAIADVLAV